jgi:serine phosphatase RsbU (regulator of sigma subunit)/sensor domain CHASE-containing protein
MGRTGAVQRPTFRVATAALLSAAIVLGMSASVVSFRAADIEIKRREQERTDLAATRISAQLTQAVSSLRGVSGLAVDGSVSDAAFEAFAREVVDTSLFEALARTTLVTDAEHDEFESSTGLTLRDTDGSGGFVPSAPRPLHVVVVDVFPPDETTSSILGFDIVSDPVRARAITEAEQSESPVISDPITLAQSGRSGIFVIHAIDAPDQGVIGYISTGLAVDTLIAAAGLDPDAATTFELQMGGTSIAGRAGNGQTRTFVVENQTFSLRVHGNTSPNYLPGVLIAAVTALLAGLGLLAARRDRRQADKLRRLAERNERIASLSDVLSQSSTTDKVMQNAATTLPSVVQADRAVVVRWDVDGQPIWAHVDDELRWERHLRPLRSSSDLPPGAQFLRDDWNHDDRDQRDTASGADDSEVVVCVPLRSSEGKSMGALGASWSSSYRSDPDGAERSTMSTIADLVSGALQRAIATDAARSSAEALSSLSQELGRATIPAQVERAVALHGPQAVTARAVMVQLADPATDDPSGGTDTGALVRPFELHDGTRGALVVQPLVPASATQAEQATITTVAELVGQTLDRITLAEQEHRTIVQLQRSVLDVPPAVHGVDLGVRYEPAMQSIGLGGDFYDVITTASGRTYVVIGDVTGHGPDAVVVMAELKTVIRQALLIDASLVDVLSWADTFLRRRRLYATAQIVELRLDADLVTLVNAGHPYPIRCGNGRRPERLVGGHRPMLGLPGDSPRACEPLEAAFAPHDLIVLYTDGLIERRTELLDQSIDRLATTLESQSANGHTIDELLDSILHRMLGDDMANNKLRDDIAIVAMRRSGVRHVLTGS